MAASLDGRKGYLKTYVQTLAMQVDGRRNTMVMVDIERREFADVPPDRSAEATGQWLAQHRSVEIVTRSMRLDQQPSRTMALEWRTPAGAAPAPCRRRCVAPAPGVVSPADGLRFAIVDLV